MWMAYYWPLNIFETYMQILMCLVRSFKNPKIFSNFSKIQKFLSLSNTIPPSLCRVQKRISKFWGCFRIDMVKLNYKKGVFLQNPLHPVQVLWQIYMKLLEFESLLYLLCGTRLVFIMPAPNTKWWCVDGRAILVVDKLITTC